MIELLFDPEVESTQLLARWASYRHIAPLADLLDPIITSRETLVQLVQRNLVRFGNAPPLVGFLDFDPKETSTAFLMAWLSWFGTQPPVLEEAERGRQWWEEAISKRMQAVRDTIEPPGRFSTRREVIRQLQNTRKRRDRVLAALHQVGECLLEPMSPAQFARFQEQLVNAKPELVAGGEVRKSSKGTMRDPLVYRQLLQALALASGGAFLDFYVMTAVNNSENEARGDASRQKALLLRETKDQNMLAVVSHASFYQQHLLTAKASALSAVGKLPVMMYAASGMQVVGAIQRTNLAASMWVLMRSRMKEHLPASTRALRRIMTNPGELGSSAIRTMLVAAFQDLINKTLASSGGGFASSVVAPSALYS